MAELRAKVLVYLPRLLLCNIKEVFVLEKTTTVSRNNGRITCKSARLSLLSFETTPTTCIALLFD